MRNSWHLLFILLFLIPLCASAQDTKPGQAKAEEKPLPQSRRVSKLNGLQTGDMEFQFTPTQLPHSFAHIQPNHLLNAEALEPFFNKVCERHTKSIRVVQIGDSHVRGHVFPREVRHRLEEAWGSEAMVNENITYHTSALATETGIPGFVFSALAKNGVQLSYFQQDDLLQQVAELQPDLLIISVGTNESHAPLFNAQEYLASLDKFCQDMRTLCPGIQFLLTTPPGSHIGGKQRVKRRGRWVTVRANLQPNPKTPEVVNCQLEYASTHQIPLWNLYEIAGGSSFACENWRSQNLMVADGVHFSHEAYTLQGRMLAEALLTEWNKYLTRQ